MANLRNALEAAIRDNPDDLAAHMAWADHAAEQGDPRGELAQVQIALEDPSRTPADRKALSAREADLLSRHREEWLGPIAELFDRGSDSEDNSFGLEYWSADECRYQFTRGWLDVLHFDAVNENVFHALKSCPTAGRLRDLGINTLDYDNPGLEGLAELPFLPSLRLFRLGNLNDQCRIDGRNLAWILERMTSLEELRILASHTEMEQVFALKLPHLRSLLAHHLHGYPLEVLAANSSMGNLVTLDCYPHGLEPGDDDAYITQDSFLTFVRSPHLRSMTHLTLKLHEIGDEGIAALIDSGLLRRLRTLDLWSGNLTDQSARLLAASPDTRGLTKLCLTHNYLTEEGIALLRATGVSLEADSQFDPESLGDDGEREHLWYGDCE